MESRFIALPNHQAITLAYVFEELFDDVEGQFLKYVEIDEIYFVLIGGEPETDLNNLILESCKDDVVSYLSCINLQDWLYIVIEEAEKLEYYEMCNNIKKFTDELDTILNNTDAYYSRNSGSIPECIN